MESALLKYHAITGLAINRKLVDGRVLRHLHKPGQQVRARWFKVSRYRILVLLKARQGQARKTFCFVY